MVNLNLPPRRNYFSCSKMEVRPGQFTLLLGLPGSQKLKNCMCVWLRIQEDSSGCCWFDGFKNQMQIVSELKAISQKLHTGRFINIFTKCKNECILPWIGMMFRWYLYLPLKNLEVEIKSNPNIQRLRWNRLTNSTVGRSESNKENTPFLHRYIWYWYDSKIWGLCLI